MTITKKLPVLPLRDIVVFPNMVAPLFVGREKSVRALDIVEDGENEIMLIAQRDATVDEPVAEDLYAIGTVATILQLLKLPDGTVKVLVEGKSRAKMVTLEDQGDFFEAEVELLEDDTEANEEVETLARAVVEQFEGYVKLNRKVPPEAVASISEIEDPLRLADSVAAQLSVKLNEKQALLELNNVTERLERVFSLMEGEIGMLQMERKIKNRVKRQMEKTQREYYLNEQMKAIQKELGDQDDGRDELAELEQKIAEKPLSEEAKSKAEQELKKLRQMSPMSAESTVVRNYLDWILALPWGENKEVATDLLKAEEVLDGDHYGLEKVKERILEYLAVQSRTSKVKGPILCLVGPPGVGKTSLGKSIAEATGREFVRVSLGGVRDESEIRGHRRTYIGSMPGRIIQSLKKAKTNNPLFLLDEIDKMGMDYRGDPASALLEVLDPEQNSTFNDHYLEVDYDLSNVMFVTTANSLNMPQPLLDRMEIISIAGYTEDEKVEIAKRHLLPKIEENHGLKPGELTVDDSAIRDEIRYYSREAGVRNLERELSKIARKAVRKLMQHDDDAIVVDAENLGDFAGVRKYRYGLADKEDQIGAVTGLVWTSVGGDLLTIEAVKMPGRGKMTVTGNLKDVMKESISAASSLVRARAVPFGIRPDVFNQTDIHVHVPEGAVPKDGPSAGIAMTTAIVSLLTANPIHKDIAMTGEVTLRGRVLPIGGLKEKLLAAHRGGVRKVLIPEENLKDLAEIPDNVKSDLEIVAVSDINEVLEHALTKSLSEIEWSEKDQAALQASLAGRTDGGPDQAPTTH
ncbi:endopeptidase La [Ponticaulis sp.]|uniref:endopeptidase La n=1 Tax=Ponticaulis sp. TaxID=2020902 RepID=UPI000C518ADC|nr:endopeptidase La [Ponticaulis sp.]MAJ08148.1 endopeptidase La [Ponticaulis sp.]|tara:strand:+ start:89379 stop:91787 length:2409 start_codon:yes stop_codon:yes gene_type:complete